MAEAFDPYYKWLGIPPKDQPPNHYRLLAIELFEPDIEVIDTAANRQMAFVQEFSTGPHLAASQKLLNEIAAARIKLLNKQNKAAYDDELRARLEAEASSAADSAPTPPAGVPMVTAGESNSSPFVSINTGGAGKAPGPARGASPSDSSKSLPKGKKLSKSTVGQRPAVKGNESSLANRRKSNELSTQAKMIFGVIFVVVVAGVGVLAYQLSKPSAVPQSTITQPVATPSTTTQNISKPTTTSPTAVTPPKAASPATPAKSPFLDRSGPAQTTAKTPVTKAPADKTPAPSTTASSKPVDTTDSKDDRKPARKPRTKTTAKSAESDKAKAAEDEKNAQIAKYLQAVKAAGDKAAADKKAAEEKKAAEKSAKESPEKTAPAEAKDKPSS